jgi:hypothetical protein
MPLWANSGKKKTLQAGTRNERRAASFRLEFIRDTQKKKKKIRRDHCTALLSALDRKKTYTVSGRRRWMSLVGVQMKQREKS